MAKKRENFKNMSASELTKAIAEMRQKEQTTRFKAEGARSKNVKEMRELRKDIARILTQLNTQKTNAKH